MQEPPDLDAIVFVNSRRENMNFFRGLRLFLVLEHAGRSDGPRRPRGQVPFARTRAPSVRRNPGHGLRHFSGEAVAQSVTFEWQASVDPLPYARRALREVKWRTKNEIQDCCA